MELEKLPYNLTICKVAQMKDIDLAQDICFIARTDEEISLVCRTEAAPLHTLERDDGWRGYRVKGPLDFSLVGILSRISGILADNGISVFAVSTYNTDYILVRADDFERAGHALISAGYSIH